ncbi:hypothetical protein ACFYE2_14125 [Kocuria sp. CPCC 205300]
MDTRGTSRTAVGRAFGPRIGAPVSTTVVDARGTSRTAVGRAFGPRIGAAVSTTVVDARGTSRTTVGRAFGPRIGAAVSTTVVDARGTSRTTVGRAFGPRIGAAVSTTVVDARGTSRTTVGRAFFRARVLLCISHDSPKELNDQDQALPPAPDHRTGRAFRCDTARAHPSRTHRMWERAAFFLQVDSPAVMGSRP